MRATNLLLCIVAACALAMAQQTTQSLTDLSKDSPLRSSGSCSLSQQVSSDGQQVSTDYSYNWIVQNISSKPILAMNGGISIHFPNGMVDDAQSDFDWFFHSSVLEPGKTATMSDGPMGRKTTPTKEVKLQPTSASCQVQILWVQFTDGSTDGDAKYGTRVLEARVAIWQGLQRLKEAYANGGREGFRTALAVRDKNIDADSYITHLRYAEKQHGIDFAYQSLTKHINAVVDHGIDRLLERKTN